MPRILTVLLMLFNGTVVEGPANDFLDLVIRSISEQIDAVEIAFIPLGQITRTNLVFVSSFS